jgi:hypothetical protein
VKIAKAARQRQIVRFGGTAMLARNNVLDVESCES